MFTIKRSPENPILLPDRDQSWEAGAVFNGSPIRDGNTIHLLYRAESSPQLCNGVEMSVSTIGHAVSQDGVHFSERRQLIHPEHEWEQFGCEDPRVTKYGDTYYIFYTALSQFPFTPEGIRVAVATTKDFKKILSKHLVSPFNAKAMTLFPTEVDGKISALITAHTDQPPATIGFIQFNSIKDMWSSEYWQKWHESLPEHAVPLRRSNNDHVEIGTRPIWTEHGWIVIFSYIRNYFTGGPRVFGIEAALLDLDNPRKIIGRLERPLLTPDEEYELYGRVPNIVFPSGALVLHEKNKLLLYYGAADSTCCVASIAYDDFVRDLKASRSEPAKRFSGNPIISPSSKRPWAAKAVFNPAAIHIGRRTHLLYRAMSEDNTSTFGYASTIDGLNIAEDLEMPAYTPRAPFEQKLVPNGNSGCEDPRLTQIGNTIYMCYTAFDGKNPARVAFTSIKEKDFVQKQWNWTEPRLISPPGMDDKDAALFPEKINGQYVFLHRLGHSIWIDAVDDLHFRGNRYLDGRVLMSPRHGFTDSSKIGIAGPPILTPAGWLLIYHGSSATPYLHYNIRAALLDRKDPSHVLSRTKDPILEPTEHERHEIDTAINEAVAYAFNFVQARTALRSRK
jgi:predicted GH43/DUF377 family glycosyl hydrolase